MQLDPLGYSKGGASGGEHTFYSSLKACLNAKISTKLHLKVRIKTLKKIKNCSLNALRSAR